MSGFAAREGIRPEPGEPTGRTIERLGDELYDALTKRFTVRPLTERWSTISIEDAYHVSRRIVDRRIEAGERVIGKKIGVTSKVVQQALDVHQPDFGWLTDGMVYETGGEMPIGERLLQPRAEGEVAFVLAKDLRGPGVTEEDVVQATAHVVPCFEVVDSRIADWKVRIQDTVADNASCGLFCLGEDRAHPRDIDLPSLEMIVRKNGEEVSRGLGSAALGSPVTCVAWLANTLGVLGVPLTAGDVILSGSWVPLEPVVPGDTMTLDIAGIGGAEIRFT